MDTGEKGQGSFRDFVPMTYDYFLQTFFSLTTIYVKITMNNTILPSLFLIYRSFREALHHNTQLIFP